MRKVFVVLFLVLCLSMSYAESFDIFSAIGAFPDLDEFKLVTIGITSVMYVAVAELYYAMGEDIPGMSGSVDFTGTDTDISWIACDLGPVFGSGPSDAGSIVIDQGSHRVALDNDALSNKVDVTITFRQADDLDGTYRIIYETRTASFAAGSEEEELVAFLVNGKDIKQSLQALENM